MRGEDTSFNSIRTIIRRSLALILALICFGSYVISDSNTMRAEAADRLLTLKACRALAIQNSMEYENAEDKIESKYAEYESAVKAIKLKETSMRQFRWSPLLSFKFPTSPDMAEASEFQYKPVAIQYDIKIAEHNLQDKTYEITEKVNNLYVEIVVLQKTIAFNERRVEALEEGLSRNQAKLKIGDAKQADIDSLSKKLESIKNTIANNRRSLEANLKKLSNMVGMDVTTGYRFESPFVEATLSRDQLDALIKYTEDRDESYYEACIAEATARAELTTNYNLVRNKYGRDANMISSYVNSALNGNAVNKKGFKKDYKSFLDKIDSYWQGKKRILFIRIPRLWFKGDMDGTRYMEDDPYVLYQNVLDYVAASNDKKTAQMNLDQSVEDAFNNYISVRNSYQQYIKDVEAAEETLTKNEMLNRIGELSFEEYDSSMDSYEELQNSMLDAMKLYTQTLYSFDRLTCGGVSAILAGTDADMGTAVVGESYIEKNTADGAFYSLRSIIQSQEFELSINIPDDFEVEITDYELWIDNIKIGDRTPKDKKLRHLGLTVDSVTEVKIRLYAGDEFIDDCIIDPSAETGPLTITTGYDIKKNEGDLLGKYTLEQNSVTGLMELKIIPDDDEVKKFKVLNEEGKPLGKDELIDVSKSLTYLAIIQESMDTLKIELYDEAGGLLYTGRFDDVNGLIRKLEEE